MVKGLAGQIISEFSKTNLRMVGLKLVNVGEELAQQHYSEHKGKPFFEKLVKHITGQLHNKENVIAICYEGENAIQKVRELVGNTHPEKASPNTIRGRYGRWHSQTDCYENVVHASDSPESAKKEIKLWFDPNELVD